MTAKHLFVPFCL